MLTMKTDMSGAASVLGIIQAIANIKPDIELHVISALCENMTSGSAYKQGDILTAMNGKTIEVDNTDAEGSTKSHQDKQMTHGVFRHLSLPGEKCQQRLQISAKHTECSHKTDQECGHTHIIELPENFLDQRVKALSGQILIKATC